MASPVLSDNPAGNYSFQRGLSPFAAGVVAHAGYEIERVRFASPLPLFSGFHAIEKHLGRIGRPPQALCATELRSPRPYTLDAFREFNRSYLTLLRGMNLLVEGANPIARTNVCPAVNPPGTTALYGFSYTVPAGSAQLAFVVSGVAENRDGSRDPEEVIRLGETTPDAIAEKVNYVIGLTAIRLKALGADWSHVTHASFYTVHNLHDCLDAEIVPGLGPAMRHGFTWHYARPPVNNLEVELDVRGCRRELILG